MKFAKRPWLRHLSMLVAPPLVFVLALVWVGRSVGVGQIVRDNVTQIAANRIHGDEIRRHKERQRILEVIEDLRTNLTPDEEVQLAAHVDQCGRLYGFDPLLVLAIIQVESSFGPRAISRKGACGLMQVRPSTARAEVIRLGWEWSDDQNLFEPALNLRLGIDYLSHLVLKFGSVERALIAYNHGETAVRGLLSEGVALPQSYLRRVQSVYLRLQCRYEPANCPDFIGPPSP